MEKYNTFSLLNKWFVTVSVFIYFLNFINFNVLFIFFTTIAFITELMMNTFSNKPLSRTIYKVCSVFIIIVFSVMFINPYLIFMLFCFSFALTGIKSKNNIFARIALSIIGGALPTASLIYLSQYTQKIDFTIYNCMFFFFGFVFLLFGITRYKQSKIMYFICCILPALLIVWISLERFSVRTGGWFSAPWDWLIIIPLIAVLVFMCVCIFIWAFNKYKTSCIPDEETMKLPVLIIVIAFLLIAVSRNIYNNVRSYNFHVQEKQSNEAVYDISEQIKNTDIPFYKAFYIQHKI